MRVENGLSSRCRAHGIRVDAVLSNILSRESAAGDGRLRHHRAGASSSFDVDAAVNTLYIEILSGDVLRGAPIGLLSL